MPRNLGEIDQLKTALDGLNQFIKSISNLSYFTGIQIRTFDDLRSAYSKGAVILENLKKTKSDITPKIEEKKEKKVTRKSE